MRSDASLDSRVLIEAELEPLQGTRFQPTGFPDLGAAEIPSSTGSTSLLVESAQSMANRLEAVCVNPDNGEFVGPLQGLSMVKVVDKDGKHVTNSVLEAHRIGSHYIINDKDSAIRKELEALEDTFGNGMNVRETAKLLFRRDVNSLLHGVWTSFIKSGRIKIPRALSSFIEAHNVKPAVSGGVKLDNVNPSKDEESGGAKEGQGHIPFSRIEYTAESITAYFNLDTEQIRNYGLEDRQTELLESLALWKVRTFLESGLRLRTACDLRIKGDIKTHTDGFALPAKQEIDSTMEKMIERCKADLPDPAVIVQKTK